MKLKKILAIVMATLMLVSAVPFAATAADYIVPDGTTEIADRQFGMNNSITEAVIPGSVKRIGQLAFFRCYGLTSVVIEPGVETIDAFAFQECTSLSSITIGEGVKTIGAWAFEQTAITEIELPDSLETLGYSAFAQCTSLKTIDLGNGIKEIDGYVFSGCNVEVINIPESVESIDKYAFAYTGHIKEINYKGTLDKWEEIGGAEAIKQLPDGEEIHAYVTSPATEANCDEPAYTAGVYCGTHDVWIEGHEAVGEALGHDYVRELTARPALVDGAWTDGTYTFTCQNDTKHVYTEAAPRADYAAYDAAVATLNDINADAKLTEASKTAVAAALAAAAAIALDYVAEEQADLDTAVAALAVTVEEIKDAYESGAALEADYSALDAAKAALAALAATDNLTSAVTDKLAAAITAADDVVAGLTADKQDIIDAAVAAAQTVIDEVNAAIADKSAFNADYTALGEEIARLEGLLETEALTDDAKAAIEAAIAAAKATDENLTQSEADTAILDAAVAAAKDAADKAAAAIADGSALKADYSALEEAIAKLEELLKTENLTDAAYNYIANAIAAAKSVPAGLTQSEEDKETMADYLEAAQTAIISAQDNISFGSALKGDYSALDAEIAALEELLNTEGLTDEAKAEIQAAIDAAKAVDRGLTQSPADRATIADAAAAAKAAADKAAAAIADGSALKADYTALENEIARLEEFLKTEGLTDAAKKIIQAAIAAAKATEDKDLTKSEADTKELNEAVAAIKRIADQMEAAIANGAALKADPTAAEKAKEKLEDLLKTENLTDEAKAEIKKEIEKLEEILEKIEKQQLTAANQDIIDSAVEEANNAADKIAADIESGAARKADYSALNAAVAALGALKDKDNLTPAVTAALEAALNDALAVEAGLTADKQGIINAAVAAAQEVIDDVNAAIADGSAFNADYTELDNAIAELMDIYDDNKGDLTAAAEKAITDAIAAAEAVSRDLTKSEADTAILNAAVKAAQAAIDAANKGITDGSYIKADASKLEEKVEELEELLKTDGLTEEAKKEIEEKIEELEEIIDAIEKEELTKADQEDINKKVTETEEVIDKIEKDIESGAALEADFTAYEAAKAALAALVNTVCISDAAVAEISDAITAAAAVESYNKDKQALIDDATAALAAKKAEIKAGIADGSALDHTDADAVTENFVDSTCYAEGSYDSVVYCSVCNAELSRTANVVEKKAHTPAEAVTENFVDSTCYAEGSYDTVVYCSVAECKAELSRTANVVEKKAHTPAEAVTENFVDSTCYAEGSYDVVVYCSVAECKAELSRETKVVEKKAHTPAEAVEENFVDSTCYREGSYDVVVYCSVAECKAELSRETKVIEKKAHTPAAEAVKENVVPATCQKTGSYDAVIYCAVDGCGAELSREAKVIGIVPCSFTNYVFNNDADWGVDGTETAACDFGCGATDTRTAVGSKLVADYSKVDELLEKIEELLGEDSLSEEMTKELEDLKQKIEDLKADPTTSQDEVDELIPSLERIKEYAAEINAERGGFGLFYWLWRFIKALVEFILTLEWTF